MGPKRKRVPVAAAHEEVDAAAAEEEEDSLETTLRAATTALRGRTSFGAARAAISELIDAATKAMRGVSVELMPSSAAASSDERGRGRRRTFESDYAEERLGDVGRMPLLLAESAGDLRALPTLCLAKTLSWLDPRGFSAIVKACKCLRVDALGALTLSLGVRRACSAMGSLGWTPRCFRVGPQSLEPLRIAKEASAALGNGSSAQAALRSLDGSLHGSAKTLLATFWRALFLNASREIAEPRGPAPELTRLTALGAAFELVQDKQVVFGFITNYFREAAEEDEFGRLRAACALLDAGWPERLRCVMGKTSCSLALLRLTAQAACDLASAVRPVECNLTDEQIERVRRACTDSIVALMTSVRELHPGSVHCLVAALDTLETTRDTNGAFTRLIVRECCAKNKEHDEKPLFLPALAQLATAPLAATAAASSRRHKVKSRKKTDDNKEKNYAEDAYYSTSRQNGLLLGLNRPSLPELAAALLRRLTRKRPNLLLLKESGLLVDAAEAIARDQRTPDATVSSLENILSRCDNEPTAASSYHTKTAAARSSIVSLGGGQHQRFLSTSPPPSVDSDETDDDEHHWDQNEHWNQNEDDDYFAPPRRPYQGRKARRSLLGSFVDKGDNIYDLS